LHATALAPPPPAATSPRRARCDACRRPVLLVEGVPPLDVLEVIPEAVCCRCHGAGIPRKSDEVCPCCVGTGIMGQPVASDDRFIALDGAGRATEIRLAQRRAAQALHRTHVCR
jgi:hypothetical protein